MTLMERVCASPKIGKGPNIDRSTRREPSAFERNTGYTMGSQFDFRDAGTNKSNARDILT